MIAPLKAKYTTPPRDKGMKSSPGGNNAKKSSRVKGMRWATAAAFARRGPNCSGCTGNPWAK
jgi:hypothetical protein